MTTAADINAKTQAARWDAEAEIALAEFIARYTDENPPPDDSQIVASFAEWGTDLLADGRARLDMLAEVDELGGAA